MTARGVTLRLNTRIVKAGEDRVELSDGTRLQTKTLIWTAGTAPNPLLACLPCAMERGRTRVNEYLEVPEWEGVWAVGDCACAYDSSTGKPYLPTAQHAIRQTKILAGNLTATLHGGKKRPFLFSTIGLMASLGRRTGVARVFGINFSGFPARFLWRTIYLSKLPRFEKKVRVALDWTLDLLFSKDIVQFLTLRSTTPKPMDEIVIPKEAAILSKNTEVVPI